MKKMNRVTVMGLTAVMGLSFVGCGGTPMTSNNGVTFDPDKTQIILPCL